MPDQMCVCLYDVRVNNNSTHRQQKHLGGWEDIRMEKKKKFSILFPHIRRQVKCRGKLEGVVVVTFGVYGHVYIYICMSHTHTLPVTTTSTLIFPSLRKWKETTPPKETNVCLYRKGRYGDWTCYLYWLWREGGHMLRTESSDVLWTERTTEV